MERAVREFLMLTLVELHKCGVLMLILVELHQCGVLMLILVMLREKHAAEREILLTD